MSSTTSLALATVPARSQAADAISVYKSSGGRDIGIQVSGDVLPNSNGRKLLHYQVGVYNGEGINTADKDNRKDIIGGLWVMPVKGLRIGAFGGQVATVRCRPSTERRA